MAPKTVSKSVTSPKIIFKFLFEMFSSQPISCRELYLTKAFTLYFFFSRVSHKCDPINPAAPVTNTLIFIYRYIIVGLILVGPPILSAHYGSIYLGKENGVLLGFSVGIICVTFACWKLYIDDWRDDED